ncbi:MAG: TonB-dependent receptor, partial [Pseudomonadota bacterium]
MGQWYRTPLTRRALLATGTAAVTLYAGLAAAQLEEVVVTAQKRESTLQETPVAVTALTAETVETAQIRDLRDLQTLAPTLRATTRQSPGASDFSIRGLGTSADNIGLEPSVGVFVDGVYRARGGAAINDFLGLERVEVLRGPQSTLFGKNTPAGVISFITREPGYEPYAEGELTVGELSQILMRAAIEGGIIEDTLAFRIDANLHERDGFLTNVITGDRINNRDRYGLRGQLLFEPSDNVKARLIVDYNNIDENCCAAPFLENFAPNEAALLALGATVLE